MSDTKLEKESSRASDAPQANHRQEAKRDVLDVETTRRDHLNAAFENPLADVPDDQLMRDVEEFCEKFDLMDKLEDIKKGAMVSKRPYAVQSADFLSDHEKEVIMREKTHKWDHPWMLYWLCST